MGSPPLRTHSRIPWRHAVAVTALVAITTTPVLGAAISHAAEDRNTAFVAAMDVTAGGKAVISHHEHRIVAPGVDLVSVSRLEKEGRLDMDILVADIGSQRVRADYLYSGVVSDAVPVSELLVKNNAVAAVNGSFFDINNSNAPQGIGISSTAGIVTVPDNAGDTPIVFTTDGRGAIAPIEFNGSARVNDVSSIAISGVNTATLKPGNVAYFDYRWGDYTRARATGAGAAEVAIDTTTHKVIQVSEGAGTGAIDKNVAYLSAGPGAGAEAIRALTAGDKVEVKLSATSTAGEIASAIGANHRLVKSGSVAAGTDPARHPRTGVGFANDGNTLIIVTVDGRMQSSRGLSLAEFGTLFTQLGAQDAVNLDGGGSTTMAVREPTFAGQRSLAPSIPNTPSDGAERAVPNGIGLFVSEGSGEVKRIAVRTSLANKDASRVFPGMSRILSAHGVDESGTTVEHGAATWSGDSRLELTTDSSGTVVATGVSTGAAQATARLGSAAGSLDIHVLDELTRLTASSSAVQLPSPADRALLTISGVDRNGFSAPIEARDITVSGNESGAFDLRPSGRGTFEVSSAQEKASATLTFTAGGFSTTVALTVGFDEVVIFDFENVDGWRTTGARSTSSVAAAPGVGFDQGQAAALTYDFSKEPATRTANARPAVGHPGFPVPGQPSELNVWVRGESTGTVNPATYIMFTDATGAAKTVYGAAPKGNAWQQLHYPIPEGTEYPITLLMVSAYETAASRLYTGTMWFDNVTALVPPTVQLPTSELVQADVIVPTGATQNAPLRVAVMSDAQFVARSPESGSVRGAREALREIVASQPDLMFINGDFVDEASPADFALARKILDEELAGVTFPWRYVTGNHEIMGGPIANFEAAFGDTFGVIDQQGTRFIWLDTAPGSLSHNFEQMRFFRTQLDAAESDSSVTGVVVLQHIPIDDPLPAKTSQLGNRLDAEEQRRWLEEFAARSGKPIAMMNGHVGIFHAKTEDGIPYILNGNSGKSPENAPYGSFTGWTMLGIDPTKPSVADGWLGAEVMTRVEKITLDVTELSLIAGDSHLLSPKIVQDSSRTVPVAWPMSSRWETTPDVWVGDAIDAPPSAVVAINPRTHEVTALRAGTASLSLSVNTQSVNVTVQVAGVTGETPRITGTPQVGQELVAQSGVWGPEGVVTTYRWLADGVAISGETAATFTPRAEHVGRTLTVEVSGVADGMPPLVLRSVPTGTVVPASVAPPAIDLDVSEVVPGETLTVTGSGFAPNQLIEVWLEPAHALLGSVHTSATGTFTLAAAIPADIPAGIASVRALDPVSSFEASVEVLIGAAATDGGAPVTPSEGAGNVSAPHTELPFTGGSVPLMLLCAAVAAVGLGAALRRRSARQETR